MTNGFKIEEGPTLPKTNHLYTCTSMAVDGDMILVASGGSIKSYLDSEYSRSLLFLNPRKENQWMIGTVFNLAKVGIDFKFMSLRYFKIKFLN